MAVAITVTFRIFPFIKATMTRIVLITPQKQLVQVVVSCPSRSSDNLNLRLSHRGQWSTPVVKMSGSSEVATNELVAPFYLISRREAIATTCQTLLYGHPGYFSHMVYSDY
jgi:hypothetical protein